MMDGFEKNQDKNSGNSSSQSNVPPVSTKPQNNLISVEAREDMTISHIGSADESSSLNKSQSTSTEAALPIKASVEMSYPSLETHSPATITSISTSNSHKKPTNNSSVLTPCALSTTIPVTDPLKLQTHTSNANANGPVVQAVSSSLSSSIVVPPLPPLKRKDPDIHSTADKENSIEKKQKIENVPILQTPAYSSSATNGQVAPTVTTIPKIPVPSFSKPPGNTANDENRSDIDKSLPSSVPQITTALNPLSKNVEGSSGNGMIFEEDFVTIKIGVPKNIEENKSQSVNSLSFADAKKNDIQKNTTTNSFHTESTSPKSSSVAFNATSNETNKNTTTNPSSCQSEVIKCCSVACEKLSNETTKKTSTDSSPSKSTLPKSSSVASNIASSEASKKTATNSSFSNGMSPRSSKDCPNTISNETDMNFSINSTSTNDKSPKSSSVISNPTSNEANRKATTNSPEQSSAAPNGGLTEERTTALGIISQYKTFPRLKTSKDLRSFRSLSTTERIQLERLFEFDKKRSDGRTWDDDWFGVLDLCNFEVQNPDGRAGERQKKRSLLEWVGLNTNVTVVGKKKTATVNNSLKLLHKLLRHVYNYKNVPEQAKLILANIDNKDPVSIGDAIQRLSIDPIVLQQDGWVTTKANEPQGASGGAHRIGEKIWWQGYLGVVIAYVHDSDMGDLWKAIWVEDLATFDLEREELENSRKKYLRKKAISTEKKKNQKIHENHFQVDGIEHGIVLATSYARGARHGVFWPARVQHASELVGNSGRRSQKGKKIDVVFLAPYWNVDQSSAINGSRRIEPYSGKIARRGDSIFSSGPMFEIETIDANDQCIQRYPYDVDTGLDIDSIRSTFKFMGLPKATFSRYLDGHRLALGFKTFSQTELKSTIVSESDRTTAALLEGHPLAVQAAHFPSSVLQLPFLHILSQLPRHECQVLSQSHNEQMKEEPALRFDRMLEAMKPPVCWGLESRASSHVKETPQLNSLTSPMTFLDKSNGTKGDPYNTSRFLTGLMSLQSLLSDNSPTSRMLKNSLNELVSTFAKNPSLQDLQKVEYRKRHLKSLNKTWIVVKSKGETLILAALKKKKFMPFLKDWRRCCERIYKHINVGLGSNGKSWVLTDSRCNLHLTSTECVERAVRLPAALKGVREAVKVMGNIEMINQIEDEYLNLAENDVITRAHKMSYIQKLKKRCMAAPEDQVVALTDDSDGNGGEDTKGAKGSWNAALLGVGAALKGLDMIFSGECLNVFCATRPPGHHAGRELHAMKAVSNGFCILNQVACASIYATTPIADGGLGLSRVCVIDIDVHHGNGTQDILCSTYDPRFLYVSMHAGGPDINGLDVEDDELEQVELHLGGNEKLGIFPGRCGDTSPHKGILNIPLGGRVTSHALGTALVNKVNPAVKDFNPEIIIVSAGFDAHKNDPLNLGGLTAEDFGTLTEVICKLAHTCCSGRVLSVMEGGYGVPCCRPQNFAGQANNDVSSDPLNHGSNRSGAELMCLDLGSDLPYGMMDVISSYGLKKRLDKCHQEGFIHCVKEHVSALARCNEVKR